MYLKCDSFSCTDTVEPEMENIGRRLSERKDFRRSVGYPYFLTWGQYSHLLGSVPGISRHQITMLSIVPRCLKLDSSAVLRVSRALRRRILTTCLPCFPLRLHFENFGAFLIHNRQTSFVIAYTAFYAATGNRSLLTLVIPYDS